MMCSNVHTSTHTYTHISSTFCNMLNRSRSGLPWKWCMKPHHTWINLKIVSITVNWGYRLTMKKCFMLFADGYNHECTQLVCHIKYYNTSAYYSAWATALRNFFIYQDVEEAGSIKQEVFLHLQINARLKQNCNKKCMFSGRWLQEVGWVQRNDARTWIWCKRCQKIPLWWIQPAPLIKGPRTSSSSIW